MSKPSLQTSCFLVFCMLLCECLLAHNGKIAYARPLDKIMVDGDFSDWPKNAVKYMIATHMSDTKPAGAADFSGFFQLGYRLDNRSLYVAFTITDDVFIEDTSANVRFDSQDGLELCIDARHLASGSGVASFMYSKKLRNINNAYYDPFARNASWKIMEVAIRQNGSTRFYEWRIMLDNEMVVGKSIGFDFMVFDKDKDGSFSFTGWGQGGFKFRNPYALGDVVLLPQDEKLATVSGKVAWDKSMNMELPREVRLTHAKNPALWLSASVDSSGNYAAELPAGNYEVSLPHAYIIKQRNVYSTRQKQPLTVSAIAGEKAHASTFVISGSPEPELLGERGILHDFNSESTSRIDHFIESYQKYYGIPGVSLALIKDGKVIYHKTYGVRNTMTGEKVDENTLFEAASITKPVFAFAVQRLSERGVIDLEKPLYEYLPYKDIEYDERYKLITAKHVLTHRTGFPNWRWGNPDGKLDIKFTPGTDYGYSGEGFEYLKMVVEKITGKKVEQVLKEEVIEPIGLYHTFFSRNDSLRAMAANGHYDMLPVYDELSEQPGMAYSMHTEAKIFTKFMLYLMEQKGLNEQSYETMFKKHSEYKYDPGDEKPIVPAYMGMSLEIRETPYGKSFGHGGNNGDFKCMFEMYKDIKMGYVVFTNSNTSDILLESLRQFFIEGKPQGKSAKR